MHLQLSLFPFNYWSYSRAGSRARKADRHARAHAHACRQWGRLAARGQIYSPCGHFKYYKFAFHLSDQNFNLCFLSGLKIVHSPFCHKTPTTRSTYLSLTNSRSKIPRFHDRGESIRTSWHPLLTFSAGYWCMMHSGLFDTFFILSQVNNEVSCT